MGGDFLRALFGGRVGVPIQVDRTPELPAFCGPHTLVVVSSYSGGTAETLACFDEALGRGCRVVPLTSGGALAAAAARAGLGTIRVPPGFVAPRSTLGEGGAAHAPPGPTSTPTPAAKPTAKPISRRTRPDLRRKVTQRLAVAAAATIHFTDAELLGRRSPQPADS